MTGAKQVRQILQKSSEAERENYDKTVGGNTRKNERKKQTAIAALKEVPQDLKPAVIEESFKSLGYEQKKQAATTAVKEVPQDLKPAVIEESFKSLEDEQKKQTATATVKEVPQDLKPEVVEKSVNMLRPKQKESLFDFLQRDYLLMRLIWLIVISCLSIAMVISVIFLAISMFRTPNQNAQMLLTVITAIIAFFGGLFTPQPK